METSQTALLVMDMQIGILNRLPQQGAAIVKKVADAIRFARKRNIPVIFVRLGFRKGLPEVSSENKNFSVYKTKMNDLQLSSFMELHHK
jgi:nicotinamidase-related amidase